jgi:copper chaperone CopZ
MLVVVVIAVPMYICATGSIPIALSLMLKGLTPGVAFVLLMAGPAVNFASYTLLSRTLGRRNTLIYIAIIALSAIGIGLVVDYLLPARWFMPPLSVQSMCCHADTLGTPLQWLCSVVLVALLVYTRLVRPRLHRSVPAATAQVVTYPIEGMMCAHCQAKVKQGLSALPGVKSVTVDLEKGEARVEGEVSAQAVSERVKALGYDLKKIPH